MIQLRHGQPSLWHSGLAKDIEDLWEPWMKEVDGLLEDAALLEEVYQAQGKRRRHSRTRGRMQTPAEVALRLLILKHVRNWSYDELEREVRANLVYRAFTRIGDQKVPDAKTLARLGQVIGPEVIRDLHERLVALAREHGVVKGRKLRVDTTVVETNIHYPTDSNLLGDGARVLNRTMKRIEKSAGGLKKKIRDRMRAVKKRVVAIALAARQVGPEREERHRKQYADLLTLTGRILNQAKGVLAEVEQLPGPRRRRLQPLTERLATMADRVRQVVKQTRARIFEGDHSFPWEVGQRVRAAHGNHSEGKVEQAHRIREARARYRRPRTRSLPSIGSSPSVPAIRNFWFQQLRNINGASDACRGWWLPTRASIQEKAKRRFRKWECVG